MAASNFNRSLAAVLEHEGGYVDHPSDPGGATNMGITRATLASWRGISPATRLPKEAVQQMTRDEAAAIYRARYWSAVKGDQLPGGLDYAMFDYGVNSGPVRAIEHLQEVLGVAVDGVIGPKTLAAVSQHDARDLVERLLRRRMQFLEGLKTWPTFGRGWTRRVGEVRATAMQMAANGVPLPPDYVPPTPAPTPPRQPDDPGVEPAPASAKRGNGLVIAIIMALAIAGAFLFQLFT